MRKSWLMCVLLGTMAWGQAQPGMEAAPASAAQAPDAAAKPAAPASTAQGPNAAAKPGAAPAAEVPENAPVITIEGLCPAAPKTAAASKAGASKTATPPAAKKPADCKTIITRAEFEKIASGLSPNVTPQLKHQLASALPRFMAMSEADNSRRR